MKHFTRIGASTIALTLGLGLVGCDSADNSKDEYNISFLAASSQNGFNQASFSGIKERAEELSDELGKTINVKLQDGQFDPNTQLSQLQNAGTTGQSDGVIVVPHDGPSLVAAFPLANDIPVVVELNPIGPDINDLEPQVEGVISTVATAPKVGAEYQANSAIDYCKDIDPCKIALITGLLSSPLDVERMKVWKDTLGEHDNIDIIAEGEGKWDRDEALKTTSNILQSNKDLNGIVTAGDQMTSGAQIALENAGIEPSDIFLTGAGGTQDAVKAVREGKWTNTYLNFPSSMGRAALDQLVNSLEGKDVKTVVDADTLRDIGPLVDKDALDKVPDFTGEWNG